MYSRAVLGTTTIARAQVGGVSSRSARPGMLTEPRSFCQFKIDPRTPCNICFVVCFETPTYMPDPDHVCAEHRYHGCQGSLIMMANAKRVCASSTGVFSFDPCVVERCRGILGPTDVSCPKCGTFNSVREEIQSARTRPNGFTFPIRLSESLRKSSSAVEEESTPSPEVSSIITISWAQFAGVNLSDLERTLVSMSAYSANLRNSNFSRSNLTNADLRNADLTGACLVEANLSEAQMRGAYLSSANLINACLNAANLTNARLIGTKLMGATLQSADLSGADLTESDCRGANFKNASLAGANIYGADLSFTNLTEEQLASTVSIVTD